MKYSSELMAMKRVVGNSVTTSIFGKRAEATVKMDGAIHDGGVQ